MKPIKIIMRLTGFNSIINKNQNSDYLDPLPHLPPLGSFVDFICWAQLLSQPS